MQATNENIREYQEAVEDVTTEEIAVEVFQCVLLWEVSGRQVLGEQLGPH